MLFHVIGDNWRVSSQLKNILTPERIESRAARDNLGVIRALQETEVAVLEIGWWQVRWREVDKIGMDFEIELIWC